MNRLGFEGRKFEDQGHRKSLETAQQPDKQVLLKSASILWKRSIKLMKSKSMRDRVGIWTVLSQFAYRYAKCKALAKYDCVVYVVIMSKLRRLDISDKLDVTVLDVFAVRESIYTVSAMRWSIILCSKPSRHFTASLSVQYVIASWARRP